MFDFGFAIFGFVGFDFVGWPFVYMLHFVSIGVLKRW